MATAIIVDDEEKNREGLAKMIDQFCPDVEVIGKAENTINAKSLIDKYQPEIIFLDIEMPGGDGFSLLEEFENPNFQIIFTTAHAAYAIKAIKFAALDYLLKPININELKIAVEKAILSLTFKSHSTDMREKMNVLKSNRTNDQFEFKRIAVPTSDGINYYSVGCSS
jgi:two-component system LytT family response regulator